MVHYHYLLYSSYILYSMNTPTHTCGVEKITKIIGSKWTLLIIRDLCETPRRFGELQRSVEGISPRTLSLRLQQLEHDGIVTKKIFAEVPSHVEYALTTKGKSLKTIVEMMRTWGETKA